MEIFMHSSVSLSTLSNRLKQKPEQVQKIKWLTSVPTQYKSQIWKDMQSQHIVAPHHNSDSYKAVVSVHATSCTQIPMKPKIRTGDEIMNDKVFLRCKLKPIACAQSLI